MSTYGIENRTYVSNTSSGNFSTTDSQTLVRVYLVNGESRCLRLDDRTEVTVSDTAKPVHSGYILLLGGREIHLALKEGRPYKRVKRKEHMIYC